MTHKALIRQLQISCLGLDRIDPLCLLVDDVIAALAQTEQEPVAWQWLDTAHFRKKLPKDAGDGVWNPLYAAPQRTERPVDCERCNRLEEQAYDLAGKLRVANIKLSMQPQRTWVVLTDEEIAQGCKESWVTEQAWQSAVWWAEAKLTEKNT